MKTLTYNQTLREKVAHSLDADVGESRVSLFVDYALIILITLNVICIILESVPSIFSRYSSFFIAFEIVSVIIFSVEYALRLWSCPDNHSGRFKKPFTGRVSFALTPAVIIDLLAIAPFYLSVFIGMDLRFLRVVRLVRVFKLTRYSRNMQLILNVFKSEANAFIASFALMLVLLVLASSGIYLLEHDVQPEVFGSIPAAMWWAMATLTTVGYGDAIPITPVGKMFGGCITLIGVGMVALPAGILASSFSEQLRSHRRQWENKLANAMEDGVMDTKEQAELETLREKLGLSEEDAQLLLDTYMRHSPSVSSSCPSCRAALH